MSRALCRFCLSIHISSSWAFFSSLSYSCLFKVPVCCITPALSSPVSLLWFPSMPRHFFEPGLFFLRILFIFPLFPSLLLTEFFPPPPRRRPPVATLDLYLAFGAPPCFSFTPFFYPPPMALHSPLLLPAVVFEEPTPTPSPLPFFFSFSCKPFFENTAKPVLPSFPPPPQECFPGVYTSYSGPVSQKVLLPLYCVFPFFFRSPCRSPFSPQIR